MKKLSLLIVSILFSLNLFSQAGQKWASLGNTINTGEYFGTNNLAPIIFKTNSTTRLVIDESGNLSVSSFNTGQDGLVYAKDDGVLQKLPLTNSGSDVLCGDGQFRDLYSLSPQTGWKLNGMTIYTDPGYQIGLGTHTPGALLDVNGDAIVRGTLYVYNGIIVGTKYTGEKVDVDTVKSTNAEAVEMKAEQYKTNTINIDGNNSTITSSTGLIDFDNTTIRANNMLTNDFHIYGTATMDSLEVGEQLKIGNNSMYLSSNSPSPGTIVNSIYTDDGDLYIQSQNYNNNTIINANNEGYVGIGTTNPQQNLHIRGITHDDFNNPPELSAVLRLEDEYISSAQTVPSGDRTAFWDIAASSHREGLYFSTDQGTGTSTPLEVMRLTESGQIVMGSTGNCSTPTNIKLIVDGHMLLTDGPTGEPRSIYWGYQCQPEWGIEYNQYDHGLNFWNPNTSSSGLVNYRLFLQDGTGYVGIGTNSPGYELDVCGTIRATEIRVNVNGACVPDFVFEDDYKLMSFEELQAYIDEFGHLPGIPSAEETEKDGINVSEMNMMLLQKVEELTLYILQLEKRINELEN